MKFFITICLSITILMASDLQLKYDVYTKYLNIEKLELTKEQLSKIVPKLEKKMQKDKLYNSYLTKIKNIKKQALLDRLGNAPIEQFICFTGRELIATIGQNSKFSGKCENRTLAQMNNDGYELIQILGGLQSAFGALFTKKRR